MAINLCTVSDKVFEADGSIPPFAQVRFELIGWDADKNTAGTNVVVPDIVLADVDDLTGEFSADIWQNGAGLRATYYKVSLLRYALVSKADRPQVTELGKIQIPEGITASDMSELLSDPVINGGNITDVQNVLDALNFQINEQTADYTLTLPDAYGVVEMNVASANTLTIPSDATLNFPIGTHVIAYQTGSGQTTIAGEAGVTINRPLGLNIASQWGAVALLKRAANNWTASGDMF